MDIFAKLAAITMRENRDRELPDFIVPLLLRVAENPADFTGREALVLFEKAYHGFDPEFALAPAGVPTPSLENRIRLPWNDVPALEELARSRGDDLAAIMPSVVTVG